MVDLSIINPRISVISSPPISNISSPPSATVVDGVFRIKTIAREYFQWVGVCASTAVTGAATLVKKIQKFPYRASIITGLLLAITYIAIKSSKRNSQIIDINNIRKALGERTCFKMQKTENYKYRRILTIDGGGVRGIMSVRILQKIEALAEKPIAELFDCFAGVSTGALIVSMLVAPEDTTPTGQPRYSPKDVFDFFFEDAPRIFKYSYWQRLKTLFGLVGPKYSNTQLCSVLNDKVKDLKLGDALKPISIPIGSLEKHVPFTFSSNKTANFLWKDVLIATTAAPTYFSPYFFQSLDKSQQFTGIDGGMTGTNPVYAGLSLAASLKPEGSSSSNASSSPLQGSTDNVIMVSLGTGMNFPPKGHSIVNNGILGYMFRGEFFKDVFDLPNQQAAQTVEQLIPENQYSRMEFSIPSNREAFDNPSVENLKALLDIADAWIKENEQDLKDLVAKLIEKA
jgi:uncharacterized protein